MHVAHLRSSPFFGGPERGMLGLARAMRPSDDAVFLLFHESGKQIAFSDEIRPFGFLQVTLDRNWPNAIGSIGEISRILCDLEIDLLCTHDYKSNLLGLPAARRAGKRIVAFSHGWTGHSVKVKLYET